MLVTNSKNNAGGEQTDLQNQPTRRNGPNQHRAHTQTPQHITEGHGGRIRDRWGLVGDRKETTKLVDRTQFKQKRCRDGCQVVPQWHKQLFKFQRIRCTTCSTSPGTKKHTCRKRKCLLPVVAHVMLNFEHSSCSGKNWVSGCSNSHQALKDDLSNGSQGTAGPAGHRKKADEWKGRLLHFT